MRILYISDSRLPSERANSVQVAKTCEALSKAGCSVTLLLPNRGENKTKKDSDIWKHYNIKNKFEIARLPVLDVKALTKLKIPHLWFFTSTSSFALSVLKYLKKNKNFDIIYSRHEPSIAAITKFSGIQIPIVYEAHKHSGPKTKLVSKADGIITITKRLKELYSHDQIEVIPDAVDLDAIEKAPSKEKARKQLKIANNTKLIVYTGQLLPWKGVPTLIEAAKELPGMNFLIVGGTQNEISQRPPSNVDFVGHVPHTKVPLYLSAADVLVIPNTKDRISREFTSPLKLFEYMAANKPIVASGLPSLREIINDDSALFFEPEDASSLAKTIKSAFSPSAKKKAAKAKSLAREYTWDKRAKKILGFLCKVSK